ncbi:sensor histidine kinase [Methanoculleus taiwanensis]|uniref:sensor histidine kinase n=1 Tax=Methanoculleus taiwanensis TaxID=1550565 RepID=UPI000FFEACE2|nr:HAMP domain-containing sensor histidine kinase [Methanoculleus taiwanensis]
MNEDFQSGSMVLALGKVAAITLLLMSVFQFGKAYLYPNISITETHITTIAFTTLLAVFAAYFVFRTQQKLLTAMTVEVRERRRAEEALIRKSEELEAARNEANMYLDIMTHDVRNANNVSSMYADLLVDLADGDLKAYVEKLHDSIGRSSEILMNVATIRRASEESSRLVPVNLDAVIRNEIRNFPDATIRYIDPPVSVLADGLLPTVLTNLVGNAVKHGGSGVEITIRVEKHDREVMISVEDTGPGIPDEIKRKLFTRFERGRASGRGEGLGLFIVRTLVERYGGKIWIEDRVPGAPEKGAAFKFTLRKADHA